GTPAIAALSPVGGSPGVNILTRLGQDLDAILTNHDKVFDPYSTPARPVDPRLDRDHTSGRECDIVGDTITESRSFVDRQANAVTQTVAELVAVTSGSDQV